ncbi:hypothetical protein P5V15_013647 [Pogonomyrmex californicus]
MNKCKRNFMNEMYDIICEIENLKPEPEVCNMSCPPLGCPRGPCPGMYRSKGICDPCCISKMPCDPPSPRPPCCYLSRCLKDYACSAKGGYSNPIPHDQSGFQQAFHPVSYNLMSTVLPCTIGSVQCWNASPK